MHVERLALARNARVDFAGVSAQARDVVAPRGDDFPPGGNELPIPGVQQFALRARAQQLAALFQGAGVALQRVIVGRLELRKLHIDKAAAFRRAILHNAQPLGRETALP